MRAEDNIPELKFDHLSIERNSFADAYFIAHSTISPIYLPIVKAGICVSLAVLSASVLPLYHTFFSGIVVPVIAISFFLLLALFFMVVWPGIIKGRGAKIFDSNQMMSLPFSVAFFKSFFEVLSQLTQRVLILSLFFAVVNNFFQLFEFFIFFCLFRKNTEKEGFEPSHRANDLHP